MRRIAIAAVAAALAGVPAEAGFSVDGPQVKPGAATIETKGVRKFHDSAAKDNAQEYELVLEAGVTDWLKLGLTGTWKRKAGSNKDVEFAAYGVEGLVQLTTLDDAWAAMGVKFAAGLYPDDGADDEIKAALLIAKPFWGASHTLNLALSRGLGAGAGGDTDVAFAWQTMVDVGESAGLGFEYFGEPGAVGAWPDWDGQAHYAGPVAHTHFKVLGGTFEAELGYMFGLTDAASDGALKWKLAWVDKF